LPQQRGDGGNRRDRRDSVGDLHAVDVPAGQLRPGDQREERVAAGSGAARVGSDRSGDRRRRRHGRVPERVPASTRTLGHSHTARRSPARPRASSAPPVPPDQTSEAPTENSEPRNENPEPRTQNPDPPTQNPEPRTQNPEPRTQNQNQNENQERRTPNAERHD